MNFFLHTCNIKKIQNMLSSVLECRHAGDCPSCTHAHTHRTHQYCSGNGYCHCVGKFHVVNIEFTVMW